MPYGGPFSEALGAAGLSHYAAQLLYKCASDPVTQDTFGRPNLPPAAIAGVHTALGAADSAPAGGGGSDQRIISYSSEPTSISSSGLAKFPSEPFVRPRTVYPQYSAFDLPPGEFHDVAWVRPLRPLNPIAYPWLPGIMRNTAKLCTCFWKCWRMHWAVPFPLVRLAWRPGLTCADARWIYGNDQHVAFQKNVVLLRILVQPGPPNAPSADEVKQEQLSFRSGPTKRFFETAEDSSQGARYSIPPCHHRLPLCDILQSCRLYWVITQRTADLHRPGS